MNPSDGMHTSFKPQSFTCPVTRKMAVLKGLQDFLEKTEQYGPVDDEDELSRMIQWVRDRVAWMQEELGRNRIIVKRAEKLRHEQRHKAAGFQEGELIMFHFFGLSCCL